jgi:hypothetical protein
MWIIIIVYVKIITIIVKQIHTFLLLITHDFLFYCIFYLSFKINNNKLYHIYINIYVNVFSPELKIDV